MSELCIILKCQDSETGEVPIEGDNVVGVNIAATIFRTACDMCKRSSISPNDIVQTSYKGFDVTSCKEAGANSGL